MVHRLQPPVRTPAGRTLLVGLEPDGSLAAVSLYQVINRDPYVVDLEVMAVSLAHRRRGGAHAQEMIEETLTRVEQEASEAGRKEAWLSGMIWWQNQPSMDMVSEHGFTCLDPQVQGSREWQKMLPIPEVT